MRVLFVASEKVMARRVSSLKFDRWPAGQRSTSGNQSESRRNSVIESKVGIKYSMRKPNTVSCRGRQIDRFALCTLHTYNNIMAETAATYGMERNVDRHHYKPVAMTSVDRHDLMM